MTNRVLTPKTHDRVTDVGLLALRVYAGLALMMFHGRGKMPPGEQLVGMVGGMGFPAPELLAWLAALAEFGGGILLALGLLTRPVAAYVVLHFCLVVSIAHAGDPIADRELPIFFGITALLYLLAGPGRFSLDGLLFRKRE